MNSPAVPRPPIAIDPFLGREFAVLRAIGVRLGKAIERTSIKLPQADYVGTGPIDGRRRLLDAASQLHITLRAERLADDTELVECVYEGYPVVVGTTSGETYVFQRYEMGKLDVVRVASGDEIRMSRAQAAAVLEESVEDGVLIAKDSLECQGASSGGPVDHHGGGGHGGHGGGHGHGGHMKPLRRFLNFLQLESNDIWMLVLFAFISGILSIATPLAIESLVNVVAWGTAFQPLLVLAMILFGALAFAGLLKLLQTVIAEIIQRRQLVRIVSDLAYRFPRADRTQLLSEDPRELANRYFDIVTIQKSTAMLLLDGISIVLSTLMGLVLLAFYHPFLLGFDIVLILAMTLVLWLLGRNGIRAAVDESISKYAIGDWLQNVLRAGPAFNVNGGSALSLERSNRLTIEYLQARKSQFRVLLRQIIFALSLQAVASTALLSLGGYLVIIGQLTLGQLVASELVVTVVVSAFARAGKSLESFYDLMAGVDKVGHLLDLQMTATPPAFDSARQTVGIKWNHLSLPGDLSGIDVPATAIGAGEIVAIVGDDRTSSTLLQAIAGMVSPEHGFIDMEGLSPDSGGRLIAYAEETCLFHGTVAENLELGREWIDHNRIRSLLIDLGCEETVLGRPGGVNSIIYPGGYPLGRSDRVCLCLIQALAGSPAVLLIDGLLDQLELVQIERVFRYLRNMENLMTVLVATNRRDVTLSCDRQVEV